MVLCTFSSEFAKIKFNSYDFLPLEKALTFHVIILIKLVLGKVKITLITIYFWKNIHINYINMIYYDRFDVSKGTDVDRTSEPK